MRALANNCRRSIFALFGTLGMTACASVGIEDIDIFGEALPDAYAAAPASADAFGASEWWRDFGDPRLTAVVMNAVGSSPRVWQQEAVAAQARARAVIAGADRLPTLSAGLDLETGRRSGGLQAGNIEQTSLALSASWELDIWGRLAAQSAAARERYLGSVDVLRGTRQSVAGLTATAYINVVEARQQVALSRRTLDVLTETARQVGNRADVGVGSPGDKFLAYSSRDSAEAGLAANREILARALRQLELLMGAYPAGTVATADRLVPVPPLPALGVPADLLARRPDIAAAERRLRATGFDVVAARRALLPAISLTGSTGLASPELERILSGDFGFWTLAGNLVQPIFQGGRLAANVDLTEAAQREAANAYVQTVLEALTEVESALAARSEIARRRGAFCSAAEAARAAERIAFNRYRQGVEQFLTVSENQQRALTASSNCLAAARAGLENHIDLLIALGGGFEASPPPLQGPVYRAGRGARIVGEELQTIFGGW